MKPVKDLSRRPLNYWITLLYVPLGLQMMFWMMSLGQVDWSLPAGLMDAPLAIFRYAINVTVLIYPAFFAYGLFYSLHLNRQGAPGWKVIAASLIPFLSAAPYLLVGEIHNYFQ